MLPSAESRLRKLRSKICRYRRWKKFCEQFAHRAFLDIELKVVGLEESALAELRKHPPQRGYVVSSFLPDALAAFHNLDRAIPLGFLSETQRSAAGLAGKPQRSG